MLERGAIHASIFLITAVGLLCRGNCWEAKPRAWSGFLASMPVNHYWYTNFPVSQRAAFRLCYRLLCVQGFVGEELAIQAPQPVEALGWLTGQRSYL